MNVQVVPKTVQYKNQNEQLGAVGGCLIGELLQLFLDRVYSSEELGKFICAFYTALNLRTLNWSQRVTQKASYRNENDFNHCNLHGEQMGAIGGSRGRQKIYSENPSPSQLLVHSCTIFLCCLDGPYRNPNMTNKDHRVG